MSVRRAGPAYLPTSAFNPQGSDPHRKHQLLLRRSPRLRQGMRLRAMRWRVYRWSVSIRMR